MSNPIPEPRDPDGILWQHKLRDTANIPPNPNYYDIPLGFAVNTDGQFTVFVVGPRGSDLSIDVDATKTVRLILTQPPSRVVWRWSTQFRAVTRKRDPLNKRHYRNLGYGPQELPWVEDMTGEFTQVVFLARKATHSEEAHGFSMNVEFKVPGRNDKWLPVTIDPDIINPKTTGLTPFVEPLEVPEHDDILLYPLFAFAPLEVEDHSGEAA